MDSYVKLSLLIGPQGQIISLDGDKKPDEQVYEGLRRLTARDRTEGMMLLPVEPTEVQLACMKAAITEHFDYSLVSIPMLKLAYKALVDSTPPF